MKSTDEPPLGYNYDIMENEFDMGCGTQGFNPYQFSHDECLATFVCLTDDQKMEGNREIGQSCSSGDHTIADFAQCIDAMDCHMIAKVITGAYEATLFVHQMVPHHQNAVNTAKALLKANTLQCDHLTDKKDPDCILEQVL